MRIHSGSCPRAAPSLSTRIALARAKNGSAGAVQQRSVWTGHIIRSKWLLMTGSLCRSAAVLSMSFFANACIESVELWPRHRDGQSTSPRAHMLDIDIRKRTARRRLQRFGALSPARVTAPTPPTASNPIRKFCVASGLKRNPITAHCNPTSGILGHYEGNAIQRAEALSLSLRIKSLVTVSIPLRGLPRAWLVIGNEDKMTTYITGAISCAMTVSLCAASAMPPLVRMTGELVAAERDGNSAKAEHLATALINRAEKSHSKGDILPWALDTLASLEQNKARYQEARRLYQRSIHLWSLRSEQPSLGLANALNNLASLYSDIGQLRRSELLCRRAVSIHIQLLGPADPSVALGYSNLATILYLEDRFGEAESLAKKALDIWKSTPPPSNRSDVAYNTLARLRLHQHRLEGARASAEAAIRLCEKTAPDDFLHLAEYFQTLGLIRTDATDLSEASNDFKKALVLFRQANAGNSLEYIDTQAEYARVLGRTGHKHQAKRLEHKCKVLRKRIIKTNRLNYSIDISSLQSGR